MVGKPIIHVVSDSIGDTACEVVLAAAGQFPPDAFEIVRLPKVERVSQVERHLAEHGASNRQAAVFHTIVGPALRDEVTELLQRLDIPAVDLMGPALGLLSSLVGTEPLGIPGVIHRTDERYFYRISCMEFTLEHDDGAGSEDLCRADIVLIGVSRTSKTPLSMYLALQGYRVANIPLVPGSEPPRELFDCDPARVFGLLSTTEVIASRRNERLEGPLSRAVAPSYADPEHIARELDDARALMRRLGCFVVRTDGKAIEESAAEISAHLERILAKRRLRADASTL